MSKGKNKRIDAQPTSAAKAEKMAIVSVRISTELKTALDRESKRSGESESVIARKAVEKYLKSA
jgi:predicted DNA-binding protein